MNITDGVTKFVGVVVNILDPLESNRVQVRLFGLHDAYTTLLKNDDLPWAFVLMPNTGSSMTGLGKTPHGLKNGATVVVEFLDGIDMQIPIVVGSLAGLPDSIDLPEEYRDPDGVFPLEDRLGQPDVNSAARGQVRPKSVSIGNEAAAVTWDQPDDPAAPIYPNNQVHESISGHVIEIDDTPEAERISVEHKSGSYIEIHPDGSVVVYSKSSNYKIVELDDNEKVIGNKNVSVDQDLNTTIKGNKNTKVEQDINDEILGSISKSIELDETTNVGRDQSLTIIGNQTKDIGGSVTTDIGQDENKTAGGSIKYTATTIHLN